MHQSMENELIARVEKLESDNRRLRRIGVLGALLLVGGALFLAWKPLDGSVEAPKFVLAGNDGKQRMVWALERDGSPGMTLFDANQKTRFTLKMGPDGTPNLLMRDAEGTIVYQLTCKPEGMGAMTIMGKDNKILWKAP